MRPAPLQKSVLFPLGLAILTALTAPATFAAPAGIADRELIGLDGRKLALKAPDGGAIALVFYSSECPISNAYSVKLNAIAGEFPAKSFTLIGVCVDPDLTDAAVAEHAKEFELKFPVARDPRAELAEAIGAKVTPEAFVIDAKDRVRYHGRIDDEFAARQSRRANSTSHELRDAVSAVLDGREVATPYVAAVGCPIPTPPKAAQAPTYSKDVALILQKNCQECHRPGQIGPFPLMTYEQAQKRALDIADVAEARTMPPWKPVPGFGPKFKHDRSLSADEVATLVAWAEADAPRGDPAETPPPAQFPSEWSLGTPDLVLEPAEDFAIPATGDDVYRCFVIPTNLPEERAISAIEYRPGNRKVVHHVLSYVDTTGQGRERDAAAPGLGYSCFSGPGVEVHGDLGGWAPGNMPSRLPDGVARFLPRGADVVMQVHYHPSGKPETDRTRIGLYFTPRDRIKQTLHWAAAVNPQLDLEPGNPNVEVKAEWPVPVDVEALAVTPHMHMLGRDMTMTLTYPDGRTENLVKIDHWDFGWQNTYYFDKPLDVPKGSVLKVVAHYDNSDANPRNPNHPPKRVRWGEATTDEMCIGFIALTKKGQDLTRGDPDDLRKILDEQRESFRRKRERAVPQAKAD